jgi:competence protein ComEC
VRVIGRAPVGDGPGGLLDAIAVALRERARDAIDALYGEESRGVVLAVLLGDRRLLDDEVREALQRTGTFHFIAISGLHAGLVLAFLSRLPLPARCATPVRLLVLLLFALATGAAPPVLRAVTTLAIGIAAAAAGRSVRGVDALAWAVAVLLAWRPEWLADLGFQLSAVATFAILAWAPRLASARGGGEPSGRTSGGAPGSAARWLRSAGSAVGRSLCVSIAASAATTPLILLHFQRLHPLGPLWNLAVHPVIGVLLLSGIVSVLLGGIHPLLGAPAAAVAEGSLAVLRALLCRLAEVPGSCIHLPPPPGALVLAATALVIGGPFLLRLSRRARRRVAAAACVTAPAVAVLAVLLVRGARVPGRGPSIWFFDVGAGSSQLVLLPGGGSILIDAGSTGREAVIGRRLARSLLAVGIRRLDALVLTHHDADHVNGVERLLDVVSAGRVLVSPFFDDFAGGAALLERLRGRGLRVERVGRGDAIQCGDGRGGWELAVLHPAPAERLPLVGVANEGSLVVMLRRRDGAAADSAGAGDAASRVLLPADIEERGTARLLSMRDDLGAGLLVAPHHGGENRLAGALLERVRPRHVVVSASGGGAAAGGLVRDLEASGIAVHATWQDGALRAEHDPGRGWVVTAPFAPEGRR